MSISFNAAHASAATSDTPPTHSVGDLIAQFAYRSGSATAPGAATGYSTYNNGGANTNSYRIGYRIATATNDSGAAYSNASDVCTSCVTPGSIWGWGWSKNYTGSSATITIGATPFIDTTGNNLAILQIGHRTANLGSASTPSGWTKPANAAAGTGPSVTQFYQAGFTKSFAQFTIAAGANSGYEAFLNEIVSITTLDWMHKNSSTSIPDNNSLTSGSSAANTYRALTTVGRNSGKYVFAVKHDGGTVDWGGLGLAPIGVTLTDAGAQTGEFFAFFNGNQSDNLYYQVNAGSGTDSTAGIVGNYNTIYVAVDFTNSRLWLSVNGGNWNGSSSNHPNTNVGGIDISSITSGNPLLYPEVMIGSAGQVLSYNGGPALDVFSDLSGFTTWDNLTEASRPVTKWDPFRSGYGFYPNFGDLTLRWSNQGTTFGQALANTGYSSGKKCFSVTVNTMAVTTTNLGIGLQDRTNYAPEDFLGYSGAHGLAWVAENQGFSNNGKFTTYNNNVVTTSTPTYGDGDKVDVAVDFDNSKIWYRVNGGNWNNDASANPATNTNGWSFSGVLSGAGYPCVSVYANTSSMPFGGFTIDGSSNFSLSGFDPWNGASAITGTAAITEANDTSSAAGALQIAGTAAITEANDTSSSAGALFLTGALNATEANDTSSSSATATQPVGSAAITEADDTLAAAGALSIAGSLAATEANDTSSAAGALSITGAFAATEADDTLSSSSTATQPSGDASITEADDTSSAAGALSIAGAAAITEADDTLAGQGGALANVADAAIVEADDALSSTGALQIAGALAQTEADDTSSAAGALSIVGLLAKTEANDTLVATGTGPVASSITADAAITEADDIVTARGLFNAAGDVIDDKRTVFSSARNVSVVDVVRINQVLATRKVLVDQPRSAQLIGRERNAKVL